MVRNRKDIKDTKDSKSPLYEKFLQLPQQAQRALEELFRQQSQIVDEKYTIAEKYIIPVVMNQFLTEYNKVRGREIALERNISSFGEQHGFTFRQLQDLRVQMVKEKYNAYLKKKGIQPTEKEPLQNA